jgi:hypothetical protein
LKNIRFVVKYNCTVIFTSCELQKSAIYEFSLSMLYIAAGKNAPLEKLFTVFLRKVVFPQKMALRC